MHRSLTKTAAYAVIFGASILGTAVGGQAEGFRETDLVANKNPLTDSNGVVHTAPTQDPNLLNPWGLTASQTSPFWVSDNGAGVSTLYNTAGTPQSLIVSIPTPADPLGRDGTPTGTVFNIAATQGAFQISGIDISGAPITRPATFLFATEDGTILGWNAAVFPREDLNRVSPNTHAIIAVDHSMGGAVYKGIAIATDAHGTNRLYVTNFHAGTVDVFDTNFVPATPLGAFADPHLPRNYAPFNIVPVGTATSPATAEKLVVTFAVQDAEKHDDVAGMSHRNRRHLRSWRVRSVVSTPHSARPAQFALGRGRGAGQLRSTRRFIVDRKFRQRCHQRLQSDDRRVYRQNARFPRTSDRHRRIVEPSCRQRRQWW